MSFSVITDGIISLETMRLLKKHPETKVQNAYQTVIQLPILSFFQANCHSKGPLTLSPGSNLKALFLAYDIHITSN